MAAPVPGVPVSGVSAPRAILPAVPVPWWAVLVALVGLGLAFLTLQENGAVLASQAQLLHEFFHDGRHALGVPCH